MRDIQGSAVLDAARQTDDRVTEPVTHLARGPLYTHALCGTPRGSKRLKPGTVPTCVICADLARNR